MNKIQTFTLVEKVYARRKKVADAKLQQLDAHVRQHEKQVSGLKAQISTTVDQFDKQMMAFVKETHAPQHFHTFSARVAAARLRHNDEVILLRYNTLKAIETLDGVSIKREQHKAATLSASQKTAKFEMLLKAEKAAQLQREEAVEEEASLEAQFSKRGLYAR